jgi:DNA-binding NarL/FixJ family response regulator
VGAGRKPKLLLGDRLPAPSSTCGTGCRTRSWPSELTPDVVLVDLDLDGESGFDVAVELARSVSCAIILISTRAREGFEELIAGSPAREFLPKSALSAQAIRELLDGDGQAPAG